MFFKNPIIKFNILVLNELNAPELLPYNYEIIYFFRELLNYQNILILIKSFYYKKENIWSIIKKMEIDRINYLVKTYHRIRIGKIENDLLKSGKTFIKYNRLSIDEKNYIKKYILLCKKFTKSAFLDFFPIKIKNIIRNDMIVFNKKLKNKSSTYVFFKVLKKKQFIEENVLNILSLFVKTLVYCIEYGKIKKLVYSGIVILL